MVIISWDLFPLVDSIFSILAYVIGAMFSIGGIIITISRIKLKKSQFKNLKIPMDRQTKESIQYYINTRGQNIDPCEEEEFDSRNSIISRDLLKFFIKDIFKNDSQTQYYIILADSGMGKTTFLIKLFLKYNKKLFKEHKIVFLSLCYESTFAEIEEIDDKSNTILLLDAFDEDRYALENYSERLSMLIDKTEKFFKVILSCRTQFFPDRESEPYKYTGKIKFGVGNKNIEFVKFYISPFNDKVCSRKLAALIFQGFCGF